MTGNKRPKVLILTGPTAIGKSGIAVRLAKEFGAEILSADSMQVYRGFDIGTGKITGAEMQNVPHHLIDIVEPSDRYTVGIYAQDANKIIAKLHKRDTPILMTGGTGLYFNALINGYNFAAVGANEEIRDRYSALALKEGKERLYRLLCARDPEAAKKISQNDQKRIIRALEICELTGGTKSGSAAYGDPGIQAKVLVLECDRSILYERINRRVDHMIAGGLEKEVRGLLQYRECPSMQAIGYKEFMDYFDGNASLQDTVELIKKRSRNYAKRQMTYFRGLSADKEFLNNDDYAMIQQKAAHFYKK